jgi:sec-independent protein translocase protein TatB
MFDIGFSKILLIFVLALIVLGPEKLPRVTSQVGRWIGRARGMARQFREQLEEEVNLEEVRRTQQSANRTPPPPPPSSESQWSPPPASTTAAQDPTPHHSASNGATPGSSAPSSSAPSAPATAAAAEPEQPVYPDTYSHAHPTDSLGRPVPAPVNEPDSGQQDWVGGPSRGPVTEAGMEKPAQTAAPNGAYAQSHERGT